MIDLMFMCLGMSICLNAAFSLYLFKFQKKKPVPTYDVNLLMRDLVTGPALVKIEYVDRSDILLRSPRHL